MRRLIGIITTGLIITALYCSDKNTDPGKQYTPAEILQASISLQDSLGTLFLSMLSEADTVNALDSALTLFINNTELVEKAVLTDQGIAVTYKNSMRGGIMSSAGDGLPLDGESEESKSLSPAGTTLDSRPRRMRTLFICPIYSQRKSFAVSLIETAEKSFAKAGYDSFVMQVGTGCTLDAMRNIMSCGVVHFYSFSFPYPVDSVNSEVYLMSSEKGGSVIGNVDEENLEDNLLALIYVPGWGNMYFTAPSYISSTEYLNSDLPLIYLGFGHSFESKWQEYLVDDRKAGACIGFEGALDADRNLAWATEFYDIMFDTTQENQKTLADWYGSIEESYQNDGKTTQISYSGPDDFILWANIHIDLLSKYSGKPGTALAIKGTGFGDVFDRSRVFLNQTQITVTKWNDTLISAVIPENAISGEITVSVGNISSNPIYFKVHPAFGITEILPDSAHYGDTIQVIGGGFGDEPGLITVGGFFVDNTIYWSDTLIVLEVPSGSSPGEVEVAVHADDKSAEDSFILTLYATIQSHTPELAIYGDTITFRGTDFSIGEGNHEVIFRGLDDELQGSIVEWSDTMVKAIVPEGSVSGNVYLKCGDMPGDLSNTEFLRIFGVATTTPEMAFPGQSIEIIGSEFGEYQTGNSVTFNEAVSEIQSWSDSLILAMVPPYPVQGNLELRVHVQGYSTSPKDFQLVLRPILDSITPGLAIHRDTVVFFGSSFGEESSEKFILFTGIDGELYGQPVEWSDSLIKVIVPEKSITGKTYLAFSNISGNISNKINLKIFGIARILPEIAYPGMSIQILGSEFGEYQTGNSVTFNEAVSEIQSWSDSLIVATVPDIQDSCLINVHVGNRTTRAKKCNILDWSETLSILQQCLYMKITFQGRMNMRGCCGTGSYKHSINNSTFDQLTWNGREALLGEWYDYDGYFSNDTYLNMTCMIASDENVIDSLYASYNSYTDMFGGGSSEEDYYHKSFKIYDVPILEISHDDNILILTFEISGPQVQQHITDIYIYHFYEYYFYNGKQEFWDQDYSYNYKETFWDYPDYPPVIRVVFSNQPIE